ncbi:uncharacterized protein LOC110055923 isoform X1 [Orbicella faveolata]|uniref:uncharacterized protein LOC110055923 isoform X1 n=1 Tax=Orbicella faveolata TaxID=48498 RepID=UPI0009E48AED|nr:uncharacterized protein LOC110055923 isoform X1 [Orbicella faveolata]
MSAEVENILRSFWEWRLKESPELATQIGVHTYDNSLDDHSLGAYAKRQDDCRDFIKKLKAVTKSELSKIDALNVKLLQREIEMYLDGSKHKSYLFPLINLEGPQLEFSRLVSWMKFETKEDYEKYFSRLEAFPTQASEFIALLEEGVRTHYVPPHLTVSHVPEQIKKVLNADITGDNHLFTPLKRFPETFSEEERESFKERGIKLIEEKVKLAFKKIHDYYFDKYLRQTRDSISCANFPNGTEFYKQALKFHIACDMTAQEVHDLGQNEVRRIRSRMDKIIKEVGFEGNLKEFLEMLRTEKRFYYDTKEELLNGCKDLCQKIIKPKLKDYFKEIPKSPFEIIEIPAEAALLSSVAFYNGPSKDGTRPGQFLVNTYKHNTRPKYEMVSLALHEAEPGHHLQVAFAMEQEGQPSFRRHVEDRRYYEVPARFAFHTAYMEGWALYCEHLGEEMGLYKDPYDLFGRLSAEILRACRLVVDTGMHAFGWSRQQAVDFMAENTATSLHSVNTEIDRYIIWPGQACAYKVGEIKIKELRRKAEQKLGDKFDIKDYHHVLLSAGPMGLDTLEEAVDEYIDSILAQ